jgi:beta-ureidopropionase
MARNVRIGLIQTSNPINDESVPVSEIQEAAFQKHLPLIEQAGEEGVQILGLQEIFNGPYFCPSQDKRWYAAAEAADGPTVERLRPYCKKYDMAMVVPIYERVMAGVYYNSAVVLDADGSTVGLYRKNHIPQTSGFWEKYFFKPGNLGYPTFQTKHAKVGVYICYDRHFPEGARLLGLNGAEVVFNPSATVAGLSQYLWELEQPAHAVANGYFMAASNRVGSEAPWDIGEFYGNSYICNPRGQFLAKASCAKFTDNAETGERVFTSKGHDELIHADCDLDLIEEVRQTWQFYRDRRPDTYGDMVKQLP